MIKRYNIWSVYFLLVLILAANNVRGQQPGILIRDGITQEPVPFAHVVFERLDDHSIIAGITDETGYVENKAVNPSILAVSYMGYQTLKDTVYPGRTYTFDLKPKILDIDEVVVTAQYAPEKADKSIYKVNVIGSRQIEQQAASNLTELLGNKLNMRTNQDGALGSSLSLQGLSGEHVKFLVDGVPVVGRMNGNIDISQLNLYNVDHIEIIEGPMSVVYGTNALAGVINIITKENKTSKLTGSANAYLESVGVYNFDGSVSGRFGRNLVSVSGGRNFFSGYSLDDTSRTKRWKPKRQYFLDGYYVFSEDDLKIKISSSYFNEKLQSKGQPLRPYEVQAFDSYFYTVRTTTKGELSKKWTNHRYMNLMAAWSGYSRKKMTYFKDLVSLNESLTANPNDHDTTNFNNLMFRGTYSKSHEISRLNYQLGMDLNHEIAEGKRIADKEQAMGDYAAFVSVKWEPVIGFMLQPGLRYIYNTKYDAPLVYSLNLKYDFAEHFSVRGSYARGFRAPSLKELYLYFVDVNHNIQSNENLEAENSHNVNVSLQYNRDSERRFHGFDLSLYYNNINNVIKLAQVVDAAEDNLWTYVNLDQSITQGAQMSYTMKWYPRVTAKLGGAVNGRWDALNDELKDNKEFKYNPEVTLDFMYRVTGWDLDFSVYYKYSGKLPYYYLDINDDVQEGSIASYNMMDVTVQKRFIRNSLTLSAGVKNLLDVTNVEAIGASGGVHTGASSAYPVGWGRTFFLRLSYVFNKY